MKNLLGILLSAMLIVAMAPTLLAQEKKPDAKPADAKPADTKPADAKPADGKPGEGQAVASVKLPPPEFKPMPDDENTCILCHSNQEAKSRGYVTAELLKGDIHWQRGLRCQDCHGGDPTNGDNLIASHQGKSNFRPAPKPAEVPEFCGVCHANVNYMRRFQPSVRTDQLAEYWTSAHGKRLKAAGDPQVATCVSCHDVPHGSGEKLGQHGIRPPAEPASPVYRTHVAETCSKCHSDPKVIAGRLYHRLPGDKGIPLSGHEYADWRKSVHGKAMMDKGDLSAPTCNNCHGNHGAAPPQTDSVANACGTCHGKIAKLFSETQMRHAFETEGLPGCATCHSHHDIVKPSDAFLGMSEGTYCSRCHEKGKFKPENIKPETAEKLSKSLLAGAEAAKKMRDSLEHLKNGIETAKSSLKHAEELGMEVSEPSFKVHKATDALTNARTLIHSFKMAPLEKALADGESVVAEVQAKADHALQEYTYRRIWLAVSLVPILIVILLLVLYIRQQPIPPPTEDSH